MSVSCLSKVQFHETTKSIFWFFVHFDLLIIHGLLLLSHSFKVTSFGKSIAIKAFFGFSHCILAYISYQTLSNSNILH